MERIVDGILFEGNRVDDAWDVTIWEACGHREVSARQVVEWHEVGPVPVLKWGQLPLGELDSERDAELIEEKRQRSLQKAAQRAQTMCRRVIKAEGFSELLTITYRENQTDRALCKLHFKEWVRRMKRALGGIFRYCASFEVQDRGAMHVHVACHKLPPHGDYKGVKIEAGKLGTAIWRSIVNFEAEGPVRPGEKPPMVANGLVFVGGKKKKGHSRKSVKRSPAKMASYVSKYIMKDYKAAPEESNRYSRSNGVLPKPSHIRLAGATLAEAIGAMFECRDGDVVVSHRLGFFKDSYWLCTEPLLPGPGGVGAARVATIH